MKARNYLLSVVFGLVAPIACVAAAAGQHDHRLALASVASSAIGICAALFDL